MTLTFITAGFSIVGAIVSVAMFIAIKFNDVKHIQQSVEAIAKSVEKISLDVNNLTTKQAVRDNICEERHATIQ